MHPIIRNKWIMLFRLLVICLLFTLVILQSIPNITLAQPAVQLMIPNVPDENQPPASGNTNWCTPTAALNVVLYWAKVHCTAGVWSVMDNWMPSAAGDSIGWFMDTGNLGSPFRFNTVPGSGTFNQDIQPGFTEFIRWDGAHIFGHFKPSVSKSGYDWDILTDYSIGYDFHTAEIDSGRPTVITFLYWNLVPTGIIEPDPSTGEPVEVFNWGEPVPTTPPTDGGEHPPETWNMKEGEEGIGHAVTGVGYWRNFNPGGLSHSDWVIVHDNWPLTAVNVAVPWQNWTSVTRVRIPPIMVDVPHASEPLIDGKIVPGEYTDADSLAIESGTDTVKVYYKARSDSLYAAFDFSSAYAASAAHIYIDANNDGGWSPRTDDYRLTHDITDQTYEINGTGSIWLPSTASGWRSKMTKTAAGWQAEFAIAYSKIGLVAGAADTIGISFWHGTTGLGDLRWPPGSDYFAPCSWGELYSSDLYVPVELSSFTVVEMKRGEVLLEWSTQTETNNFGFEIQRRSLNTSFETITFVQGYGTSAEPQTYSRVDASLQPGLYFYRLKQIDHDGSFRYFTAKQVKISIPENLLLYQNYPNPFNQSTRIKFQMPEDGRIFAGIIDLNGRQIRKLCDRTLAAGYHELTWDGKDESQRPVGSGLYLIALKSKETILTRKILVIK